ncbi:hypothetical protein [Desulfosediminicola ganghwensis]|uniref:hypothetical protein n=1 Tax=Desulfosediminicola ganghwensis TaxID=2569540 RepID=UPI0010AC219D|nr:hypothetical protein [Desulfosediminicola ganghwensis]
MRTFAIALALPLSLFGMPLLFSVLLAPLFFAALKYTANSYPLAIPSTIKRIMLLASSVIILWLAARFLATTVPGGGTGYMVTYYGKYTILPAAILLLLLDIVVIFRSYGKKIGNISVIVVVIAALTRAAVPHINEIARDSQWEEHCKTAVDKFNISEENIEQLEFFNFVVSSKYVKTEDGQVRKSVMESPGQELLRRRIFKEYERAFKKKSQRYRLTLEGEKEIETSINHSSATHRVSGETKNYANGPGSKRWFEKETVTITNLKTGDIIAQRVLFRDPFKKNRSCAETYSATDFIEKVILKSNTKKANPALH